MSPLVVIPDVHQDWDWVESILSSYGSQQRFLFTGDYFDYRRVRAYSHLQSCDKLRYWMDRLGDRATWLLGNHDAQYHPLNEELGYQLLSVGFNEGAADYIARNTDWGRIKIAHAERGFLFTHAGVGYLEPLRGLLTPDALAEALNRDWSAMDATNPHPYLIRAGYGVDGGGEGGPFWHRPHEGPLLPVNQMMGHTVQTQPRMLQPERHPTIQHWYLDCMQHYWVELDTEMVNICMFKG